MVAALLLSYYEDELLKVVHLENEERAYTMRDIGGLSELSSDEGSSSRAKYVVKMRPGLGLLYQHLWKHRIDVRKSSTRKPSPLFAILLSFSFVDWLLKFVLH